MAGFELGHHGCAAFPLALMSGAISDALCCKRVEPVLLPHLCIITKSLQ